MQTMLRARKTPLSVPNRAYYTTRPTSSAHLANDTDDLARFRGQHAFNEWPPIAPPSDVTDDAFRSEMEAWGKLRFVVADSTKRLVPVSLENITVPTCPGHAYLSQYTDLTLKGITAGVELHNSHLAGNLPSEVYQSLKDFLTSTSHNLHDEVAKGMDIPPNNLRYTGLKTPAEGSQSVDTRLYAYCFGMYQALAIIHNDSLPSTALHATL